MSDVKAKSPQQQWWMDQSREDRARMLVPFVQLATTEKPQKCPWQDTTDQEFEQFLDMLKWAREANKTWNK